MPDDQETVDFQKTVVDRANTVRTVQITARPLRPNERGRATWPRVNSLSGRLCIVQHAVAWPGAPHEYRAAEQAGALITWTFDPPTATIADFPVPLGRVQYILDDAGVTWSTGPEGHRKGRQVSASSVWRWYRSWDRLGGEKPTLREFAEWLGVKSRTTARTRLDAIDQTWPPTDPKRRPSEG